MGCVSSKPVKAIPTSEGARQEDATPVTEIIEPALPLPTAIEPTAAPAPVKIENADVIPPVAAVAVTNSEPSIKSAQLDARAHAVPTGVEGGSEPLAISPHGSPMYVSNGPLEGLFAFYLSRCFLSCTVHSLLFSRMLHARCHFLAC